MSLFTDQYELAYKGYQINVEGASSLTGVNFRLSINNKEVDFISGFLGQYTLRGTIEDEGKEVPVTVRIKQGIWGTKYKLLIDGREQRMNKAEW